jgi:2-oxoglutarate dehydrogenase E2 component (dihydrolipoamide succinyltransferase)
VRMSGLRRTIATKLVEVKNTTAMLTTFNEIDMTQIMTIRSEEKEQFEKKYGVKLGFLSFFVRACSLALKAFPDVNAFIEGEDIVYQDSHHIGIAVSTEKGLFVPVLRGCEVLSFPQIESGVLQFAKKAREGKIGIEDLQGGTFTITNGGVFGSLLSTPILNPPQSAILGMHKIQQRPVVIDNQIVIRPMMYLALSYDHRIIDGKEAVGFLVHVKESLENPAKMLLES